MPDRTRAALGLAVAVLGSLGLWSWVALVAVLVVAAGAAAADG
ncbi:MAG: hypothetical protein AB7O44_27555 [Hyphomicrobiaceae bacterium]